MGSGDTQRAGQELTGPPAAWDYPWAPAGGPGLLAGDRFTSRSAADLLQEYGDRAAVVAVGSNASPQVLQRKLCRKVEHGVVPILPGVLVGCAVGHSAHVSVPGYVAAAPYRDPRARTAVFVSLLDEEQLARLDATEPNYVRRRLADDGRYRLELGDARPRAFHVYDGRWGVIAPPDDGPVPFTSQHELHGLLRARWPAYEEILGSRRDTGGGEETTRLLAADEDLRTAVREALRNTGWARPSGLAD
jgi:hypothetical protein